MDRFKKTNKSVLVTLIILSLSFSFLYIISPDIILSDLFSLSRHLTLDSY